MEDAGLTAPTPPSRLRIAMSWLDAAQLGALGRALEEDVDAVHGVDVNDVRRMLLVYYDDARLAAPALVRLCGDLADRIRAATPASAPPPAELGPVEDAPVPIASRIVAAEPPLRRRRARVEEPAL